MWSGSRPKVTHRVYSTSYQLLGPYPIVGTASNVSEKSATLPGCSWASYLPERSSQQRCPLGRGQQNTLHHPACPFFPRLLLQSVRRTVTFEEGDGGRCDQTHSMMIVDWSRLFVLDFQGSETSAPLPSVTNYPSTSVVVLL